MYNCTACQAAPLPLTGSLTDPEALVVADALSTLFSALENGAKKQQATEREHVQEPWLTFLAAASKALQASTNEAYDGSNHAVLEPLKCDCPFILKGQLLVGELPSAMAVVSLGEWKLRTLSSEKKVKVPHSFTAAEKGQLVEAAELLLRQQRRNFVLAFLATGLAVQFFKIQLTRKGQHTDPPPRPLSVSQPPSPG